MDSAYALVSTLPPELVAEILDILQRASPRDVLSYCASNAEARQFCQAPVVPWQRRYAELAPHLGDAGDLVSVLDIAYASIRAEQEARQRAQQEALNARRCATEGLMKLLGRQPDYQDVPRDMPLEAYLDALPPVRALDEVARRGDLALIDADNPDTILYPVGADGLVPLDIVPHTRTMTLFPLTLSGAPLGDDWFSDTLAVRQLTARRYRRLFYQGLTDTLMRGTVTREDQRCLNVDYARALRDLLPNAKLYYAEIRGTPEMGYGGWVLAPRGPLPTLAA